MLRIPPVLCVSAFGRVADVKKTVSADFKSPGSSIILVGKRNIDEMGGSAYYDLAGYLGTNLPRIDLRSLWQTLSSVHRVINTGRVLACHDISEGGLADALAEMCFGGGMGARLTLPEGARPDYFLFNETAGCFLMEIAPDVNCYELFAGVPYLEVGYTVTEEEISVFQGKERLFGIHLNVLKEAWKNLMQKVFHIPDVVSSCRQ